MTMAASAGDAFVATLVVALLARIAGALSTSGTVAGFVIGMCVSAGFGLPGLAVLGTFFVVGTVATRIGWKTKKARGTAEAGEGRRDWKRVVGKGGIAAACGLLAVLGSDQSWLGRFAGETAFPGAVAAALADTLGTEIGTLFDGQPRAIPSMRRVPVGTPGGVSFLGTLAAAFGALLVGVVCCVVNPARRGGLALEAPAIMLCGVSASLIESIAVGAFGLRAPGFVRNVLTTLAGAALSYVGWLFVFVALLDLGGWKR